MQTTLACYRIIWPKDWPDGEGRIPSDQQMFDLLEFGYELITLPQAYSHHDFFRHDYLNYDAEAGREKFAHDVNRISERQGLAFELREGEIYQLVIDQTEHALIDRALAKCGGVKTKAADFLGINRNTLNKKVKDLGIQTVD